MKATYDSDAGIIIPASLRPDEGDLIAILSPASVVKEEYIDGAVDFLESKGFRVKIMPSAKGPSAGSYAAPLEQRVNDFRSALEDKEVKAILCARGGYGCIHLLPDIPMETVRRNPKWLIGFSDVSALHALWLASGVASIHGPMAKHLATKGSGDPYSDALISMLENDGHFEINVPTHPLSRTGMAQGILCGGNLAVLNSLAATPYDMLKIDENEDVILFLEDISEKIYAVERMLSRLLLSGMLRNVKGLILGSFTEYGPDKNFATMEEMADNLFKRHGLMHIPIAFGFPVGHTDDNYPLTEGMPVEFIIGDSITSLKTL